MEMAGEEGTETGSGEALLNKKKALGRSISHAKDELHSFRSWLRYMFVDQSTPFTSALSWSVFVIFALLIPLSSHFFLACDACDARHSRPYDGVVQTSLSSVATLSFVCLSRFVKRFGLRRFLFFDKLCNDSETVRSGYTHQLNFGLRRFLFFDKLCNDSETVRTGYTQQLNRSLLILFIFVLPCFAAEAAYKIWWYASGASRIPFLGNVYVSDFVACLLELLSWLYRTIVFFLVCVLFRLICYLQILRLQDFAQVFQNESDVESVLREHLRIRRHLKIISHRYRVFILFALIIITVSLFFSLLMTTKDRREVNFYRAGELALCSVSLLAGLMILLRSATRITHKAQSVTSLATKWHVCATIDSFETADAETPAAHNATSRIFSGHASSGEEDVGDEEDELDNTNFIPAYAYSTISFQKRQALVTYFENNKAGITIFGFMLDRGSLHTIFGLELSLVLWLLGKTIASL